VKVGDLVRMSSTSCDSWHGKFGIISKVPRTEHGMWAILLSTGEIIGTGRPENMEVISESR
jgi:hypothetical protein